jgi:hypothetical protein
MCGRVYPVSTRLLLRKRTHCFSKPMRIKGAVYHEVLNRLARPPESLPGDTETAVVYYLPADLRKGLGESSLVLNRLAGVERGLEVNATLVYTAESLKPAEVISAAGARLGELLRSLGLEWIGD